MEDIEVAYKKLEAKAKYLEMLAEHYRDLSIGLNAQLVSILSGKSE